MYKKMHAIRIPVMNKWKEKSRRTGAFSEFKVPLGWKGNKKDSKWIKHKMGVIVVIFYPLNFSYIAYLFHKASIRPYVYTIL
jgi:hypothetical protein